MTAPIISIHDNEQELTSHLCKLIEEISQSSCKNGQHFKIGLSGGSMTTFLSKGLIDINTDWSKWILFFCDERVVPVDDPNSTFGIYKKKLLEKIPLQESQFIKIKENVSAEDAAVDYALKIKEHFPESNWPKFDLLLLGMGPDGHTASLFPDHPVLKENDSWVVCVKDSPKPPSSRITLTFPVINNACNCIFAITGKEKAAIVKEVLKDSSKLPASLVRPSNGKVYWILDKAAASQL